MIEAEKPKTAGCPDCGCEYHCPCKSCKKNFPERRHWLRSEINGEDFESCPNCGLTKHYEEWYVIITDQALAIYDENERMGLE